MAYNYIDNGKFTAAVIAHRLEVLRDREPLWRAIRKTRSGPNRVWAMSLLRQHRDPPVSDYLGTCFLALATRIAERPNFCNHPHVEEMIGTAILDMTRNAAKFDPRKGSSAFSYFTRLCFRTFFTVLKKESALESRFVLGDIPESIDFAPPALPVPVSSIDVEHGTRSLLQAWVNHHGANGYIRRGWPPVERFEQLTLEYLQENPPQAATLPQGAPQSVR